MMGIWKGLFVLFSLGVLVVAPAYASVSEGSRTGVGVVFGEPTGIVVKHWPNYREDRVRAWDAGLAYSFNEFLLIYADHLWHYPAWAKNVPRGKGQQLMPYIGVGGLFVISTQGGRKERGLFLERGNSVGVGVRIPFGVEWLPVDPPVGVFLELVPGLGVVPGVEGFFHGGIGFRYYFN